MIDEPAVSRPAPQDNHRTAAPTQRSGPADGPGGPPSIPDPEVLIRLAVTSVPHSDHACLSSAGPEDGALRTLASSDEVAESLDAAQAAAGHGPFYDARRDGQLVHVPDLENDGRWPDFAPQALAAGARAVLSVQLQTEADEPAALTFYADRAHAFEALDFEIAEVFASIVALAMQGARYREQAANLEIALASNRQIGTAIGIIMARELVTAEQAFVRLRDASQRRHRKLRDIADDVVRTGQVPEEAGPAHP